MPIQYPQSLDVRKEDLVYGGDFRLCDTYRGGGGYDQFPYIAERRLGRKISKQFVVQLKGCHLACPYCYVTKQGYASNTQKYYTAEELVQVYLNTKSAEVFHLMGGAPALHLEYWKEILDLLPEDEIFHSDLLLTEKKYEEDVIKSINRPNTLYAVNIKGTGGNNYFRNTGKQLDWQLFHDNLSILVAYKVNFYITFTNPDMNLFLGFTMLLANEFGKQIFKDSFIIDLKLDYKALTCNKGKV
jgi:hypothetical protein